MQFRFKKYFFSFSFPLFLLIYTLVCGLSVASELVLEDNIDKYVLGKNIEYFEDKEKLLTISDVSQEKEGVTFTQSNKYIPSFGFTHSAYWFRLQLRNPSIRDKTVYLEISNSYIDQIDFFKLDESEDWVKIRTGELFPFETREIKSGTFVFKISLPKEYKDTYYLRFTGDSSLDVPLHLYSEEGFQDRQYKRNIHTGFYFGIIFIMLLTSLFLFFQIRDLSLLYYFFYLATQPLVYSNFKGLIGQYLWPQYAFLANQRFFLFYSLSHVCFLLFTRAFLETHKHMRVLDRILLFEIIVLSACMIPGMFAPYQVGVQFLMITVIVYQTTALVVAIVSFYHGKKSAGYYLLAFTPMILSTIIFILLKMNFLTNNYVIESFFRVNHFVKLSLLSIAIIGRVKILYDEKQVAIERIDHVKDEFLAKTSHELRTPLHGIIGITESLLGQNSKNRLPSAVMDQLNIIMAAGKRLASLVDDILDVSKLKNKEVELNKRAVDFKQVTEIVLALCRPLTIGKKIKLINTIPEDIPPVIGDENRLQQIMHNLVGNAIKFTDRGEVRVSAEQKNKQIQISVHDTGRGIPPDQYNSIFLSFEQAELEGTSYLQGSGLGLNIVKNLVELHGGAIDVVSEEGQGTTFSFNLPICSIPADESVEQLMVTKTVLNGDKANLYSYDDTVSVQNKYNILVVDDEPINLQVVTNHLSDKGYNIKVATCGEDAIAEVEQNAPHLILLDIMMPGMSGFEVCRKVRENHPKSQIVIIFLTAKNQVSDLVEGFSLGANDYLSKPFSKNELLTRVKFHLDSLQMVERLVCLTEYSCNVSKMSQLTVVFQEAFKLICEQLSADYGALVSDEKIIERFGDIANNLSAELLLTENGEDDHQISVQSFQTSTLMRIHPHFFREYGLLIMKDGQHAFNDMDVEFVRNILTTIKITRDNLREIVSDARFMSSLNKIQENLKSVVYIKSQRNYCLVTCDDDNNNTIDLRISIQKIQTFFKESELLKINRSTLINPWKVRSLQRIGKQKYSVTMINDQVLPISRSLERQVRSYLDSL